VVCAYPITPQTHIVEDLGNLVRSGELQNCDFLNVESEMAAISVTIGSQAAGVRSYTATSSQGLLYMIEGVYNASGLELPLVVTLGNRAIGAPINIWNDHSDAMAMRDAGWIMLFAETNQEAVDLHIQAFKIAEETSIPVMVCVDGFILTHAYERVDLPSQEEVDDFLPIYNPRICLDPENPIAIGTMVPPEYFMELKYGAHVAQKKAYHVIDRIGTEFQKKFKRDSGGLIRTYGAKKAKNIIITLGSVAGTIKDVVDELGDEFGVISIISYRPFPADALANAVQDAENIIVVEKALAPGIGGILVGEVELALRSMHLNVRSVIAGLGGRMITKTMLIDCILMNNGPREMFLGLEPQLCCDDSMAREKFTGK
jgi:pyruvate ferredoxin oxidoreductase alpha subunit